MPSSLAGVLTEAGNEKRREQSDARRRVAGNANHAIRKHATPTVVVARVSDHDHSAGARIMGALSHARVTHARAPRIERIFLSMREGGIFRAKSNILFGSPYFFGEFD